MPDLFSVKKAVIPAAGFGTRSLPWSKAVPKEMLPIVDVPAIQVVIEEAIAAGIREIVVVTGRGKGAMEDHFDRAPELEAALAAKGKTDLLERVVAPARDVSVVFVRQKEPLGLGHAVLAARPAVGDAAFAVLLPDDLVDHPAESGIAQVARAHREDGRGAVAIMEVPEGKEHLYGIVAGNTDDSGRIEIATMVEKPPQGTAPSRDAIIGRYVLPAETFSILEKTPRGAGGEIQLTDALVELAAAGKLRGVRLEGTRHDIGNPLGFLEANLHYALARPELAEGVRALLARLKG